MLWRLLAPNKAPLIEDPLRPQPMQCWRCSRAQHGLFFLASVVMLNLTVNHINRVLTGMSEGLKTESKSF